MGTFKKWLPALIQVAIAAVVVYFVAVNIPLRPIEIVHYLRDAGTMFYVSLLLFTLFMVLEAGIWVFILNHSGRQLTLRKGLTVFINSQFAKYIPGGIWNYAGRVVLAGREGVKLDVQTTALIYENVLLVLASFLYALVVLIDVDFIPVYVAVVFIVAFVLFYIFYDRVTVVLQRGIQILLRKFPIRRLSEPFAGVNIAMPRNHFFQYLGCFLGSFFVMGVSFWLLLGSFDIRIGIFYAAGTFAAAWLLGLLSPLPGGLGVREGLLVYFLSFHTDTETALHISLIARIWTLMGEVLFCIILNAINFVLSRAKITA